MVIRPVLESDRGEWHRMRCLLWPEEIEDHEEEIGDFLERRPESNETLVLDSGDDALGAFIEVGERSCAEDCESSPIAYVEGWYVDANLRRQGWGAALFRAAEDWARKRGHTEIASDAVLDNEISIAAHKACGYEETCRIVCFRKSLASDADSGNE